MKSFYCGIHSTSVFILLTLFIILNVDTIGQTFKLPKEFGVAQADSSGLDSLLINNTSKSIMIPPGWADPINTGNVCGVIIALEADPNINGIPINQNDVIGAFFENYDGELECGGIAYWPDTAGIVMSVFGDNNSTPDVKEGFSHGEPITYKLFSWQYMGEYLVDEIDLDPEFLSVNKWYKLGLIRLLTMNCNEELWITASSDQDSLCNEGTVSFQAEIIEGSGNITYNWTSEPPGFSSTLQNPAFFVTEPTLFFVEASDGINQSVSMVGISVTYDAMVEAGENISTCGIEMLELNATAEHTSSITWSSSGDGTFTDPHAATTTYFLGINDQSNSLFNLSLTGYPEVPCVQLVSDTLEVEIYPTPIIILPETFSTCQTSPLPLEAEGYNLSEVEWSTEGNGFFINGNTLSPIYIPGSYANSHSSVTLTITGMGIDPCEFVVMKTSELLINKNAFCSAGADASICGGEPYEMCGATAFADSMFWSTDGDGTFNDVNITKPLYTPGPEDISNGEVELTLTVTSKPPCIGTYSDKVRLFLSPPPVIDAGEAIPAYGNPEVVIIATGQHFSSVLWVTAGDGTFEQIDELSTTYTGGAGDMQAGVVELFITANPLPPCSAPVTDNVLIIFDGGATANAGPDQTICSDQDVTLQGSATEYESVLWTTSGDGTFSNPDELNTQYFPGYIDISSGEAFLTLTPYAEPPNGAGLSDDMLLTIFSPVSLSVPSNGIDICMDNDILLQADAENFQSLNWTTSGDGYFNNPNSPNTQYFPGNGDLNAGEVSVTISATSLSPCTGNASENISIDLFNPPQANAGSNGEICAGSEFEVIGTATNYSAVSWSTTGNGVFDDSGSLEAIYTPGSEDILQGSVFLTLTAQPVSPCQVADTDQLNLNILKDPVCNAGNNLVICEGDLVNLNGIGQNYDYTLWTTAGDGSFQNPSSLFTKYYPGNSDIQNQSVVLTLMAYPEEPCQVVATDTKVITIQEAPEVDAGSDVTVCETNIVELNGFGENYQSIQWNTSGDGFFEDPFQLNTTYTPGALDISGQAVDLCLNATGTALCGNSSSCINVTIVFAPTVNAGSDATSPVGIPYTTGEAFAQNFVSAFWSTTGNGIFNDPGLIETSYTPSMDDLTQGVVTLSLTAVSESPCQVNSTDNLDLTVNSGCNNASAFAGNNIITCSTTSAVLLSGASVQDAESVLWTTTGDGTFSDEAIENPEYSPGPNDLANGMVELCITAFAHGICEDASDCIDIEFLPSPTVNIFGNDFTICDTETIQLSALIENAESFVWTTNGTGSFDNSQSLNPVYFPGATDIQNGNIQLCITATGFANCQPESDCINVSIVESPLADAGVDQTICESVGAALDGLAQNYTSLYWETAGDGTFLNNGTLFAVYNPGPDDIQTGSTQLCLIVNGNDPCEQVSDCINITIVEDPSANAGNDITVCSGENAELNGSGENYNQIYWSTNGDGTFDDNQDLTTVYVPGPNDEQYNQVEICLTATGQYNCDDFSDCLIVTINPLPDVNAGNDMLVCEEEQVQLNATAAFFEAVLWSTTGDGYFDDKNTLNAKYTPGTGDIAAGGAELCLTATGINGCDNSSDCINITIAQNPQVSVGDDLLICEGETVQLEATASNYTTLQWSTGATGTFSHPNQLSTTFTPCAEDIVSGFADICLTATGAGGCGTVAECLTVLIQKLPNVYLGDDITLCADEYVELQATVNFGAGQVWSSNGGGSFTNPNGLNTTYIPSPGDIQAGTINVCLTAFGLNGCENTQQCIQVTFEQAPVAEAGVNTTICQDQVIYLSGIAENYSNILWLTSGDGNFADHNSLSTTYAPGSSDIETGSVKLTLEVAGQNYCETTSDSLLAVINKNPVAFAGEDFHMTDQGSFQTSAEAYNYETVTWETSGDGTFDNYDTTITSYFPGAADILTGSVELEILASPIQPCTTVANDIMILYFDFGCLDAVANAGGDAAICLGSDYQLEGSSSNASSILWTTQGDGTFENPGNENSYYFPGPTDNETGEVIICMEAFANGDCQNGTDCMTLTIQEPPVAYAGSDNTIPENEIYHLSESYAENYQILQWFTTNGTGSFTNSNTENPTYAPGTIDWIIGDINLCLTASPTNPCNVSETSTFQLSFTEECEDAVADAGEDISLCEGEMPTTIALENAFATNYTSITWSTAGDGFFNKPHILKPLYTPGPQDIQNGETQLTLFVEGWNECSDASDIINIQTFHAPVAEAGTDITVCGEAGIPLFASAQNYSEVQWTSSGDGVFDNPNILNPLYLPGTSDLSSGFAQLCLTALSQVNCPASMDCLDLTMIPNATADAGNDDSVCAGDSYQLAGNANNYSALLWISAGDGTFNNTEILDPVYYPGFLDLTTGNVNLQLKAFGIAGCADIISNMLLEIIDVPVADAGNNDTIAAGETYSFQNADAIHASSVLWETSGDGTFDDETQTNPTYFPGNTDIDILGATLTIYAMPTEPCTIADSDDMFLTILEECEDAIADAGNDISTCDPSVISLYGNAQNQVGVIWQTSGDGTFDNATIQEANYFPGIDDLTNGFAELCLTAYADGDCNDSTDCLMITFIEAPTVNAGNDISVCDTESFANLNGFAQNYSSIVWSTSGTGYFWPPGSLEPKYFFTNLDKQLGVLEIVLTASKNNCDPVSDTLIITIFTSPLAYAGEDDTICGNEEYYAMDAFAADHGGILWETDGDGTFDDETMANATYFPGTQDIQQGSIQLCLTALSMGGCEDDTDCLTLFFNPDATADAGDDIVVCETDAAQLNGSATNYEYVTWTTGGDGSFDNPSSLTAIYAPGSGDIATGQATLQLTAFSSTGCGDAVSETSVFIIESPTVYAGDDQVICETDAVQLSGNAENYSGLMWTSDGDGSFDDKTSPDAIYTPGSLDIQNGTVNLCLMAYANDYCQDVEDCLTVSLEPAPTADAGQDITICKTQNAVLSGAATNFSEITWETSGDGYFSSPGILTPVYFPGNTDKETGTVTITLNVISSNSCPPLQDDMVVTIEPIPEINTGSDQTICSSDNVILDATGINYSSILWTTNGDGTFTNPDSLNAIYTPGAGDIQSGSATLCITAYAINACEDVNDCVNVSIEPEPEAEAGPDITICEGETYQADPDVSGYSTLIWSTNGDGTFDDVSLAIATYTPGPADINSGIVELCLSAEPVQFCSSTADCLTLHLQRQPFAWAGDDVTIQNGIYSTIEAVATNFESLMWETSGTGTFSNDTALSTVYTPGNLDYQNGAVTLTLSATAVDPCTITVSDDLNLTLEPDTCLNAIADAGENTTVCKDNDHQLNGEAYFYTGLLWTTNGDGTFNDAEILNATYFPGENDYSSGQAELCMEAFGEEDCENDSDCMTLTFQTPPFVFAGSDNTIPKYENYELTDTYAENYQILQWYSTNGTGDFENSNEISTTYMPGTVDWLMGSIQLCVTASPISPCEVSVTDCLTLTFSDDCNDAVADAGDDISLCEGETTTEIALDNAFATNFTELSWTTNGDGTFNYNYILNPVYTFGPQDIANGGAELTLEVNGWNDCNSASDILSIETVPAPEANAGSDITVCGNNGILLFGSASDYSQILWTTSGDGSYDNPASLNPIYFPGINDMSTGLVQLCMAASGQGSCPDAMDCMELTLYTNPTANAGDDAIICNGDNHQLNGSASGFESVLWTTAGDGSFDDQANLNAVYFPGGEDMNSGIASLQLTAFGMGDCADISSEMVITIINNPTAYAGENDTIEAGESYYLANADAQNDASVLWATSGDGSFDDKTLTKSTYTPGAEDIANMGCTLTITVYPIEPCTVTATAEMFLFIEEPCNDAVANAGQDVTACNAAEVPLNGQAQYQNGVLWETAGDGTFDNESALIATYFPGSDDLTSGTTELCLTAFADDDCIDDTDCLTVSFFDNPVANAGDDIFTCDIESFVNLNGFAENYSDIQWSTSGTGYFVPPASLTPKYFFTILDKQIGVLEIVLTAYSDHCGLVNDTMIITINPSPLAYAGDDYTICGNEQHNMEAFAASYDSLQWSTSGDGTFDNTGLLTASYFPGATDIQDGSVELCLTAFGMNGCDDITDCLILTLNPSAFASAGENQTICESEAVQLNGTATNYDNVLWTSFGDGSFDDKTILTPTYTPGPEDILNNQVTLQLIAYSSSSCGDAVSETTVSILNSPDVNAGEDQAICETDVVQLGGFAEYASNYTWTSNGDGTFDDETALNAIYVPGETDIQNGTATLCLTAFAESNCPNAEDCLTLTIESSPTAIAGEDVIICETETVALSGTAANFSSILWETSGDGTFANEVSLSTIYYPSADDISGGDVEITLHASATALCIDAMDALQVTIKRNPIANAGEDQVICETGFVQLAGTTDFTPNHIWTTDGDGEFNDKTALDATYTPGALDIQNGSAILCLTAQAEGSCEDSADCMTVTIELSPTAIAGEDVIICENETVTLAGSAANYSSVLWETSGDGTFEDALTLNTIYYPGITDISSGVVEVTLNAMAISVCDNGSDVMIVTIDPGPTVDAGDDVTVCETEIVQLNATSQNADQFLWFTAGDGAFDDKTSVSTIYTPGPADIVAGTVDLCLSASGPALCPETMDCLTVTIQNIPEVSLPDDFIICEGDNIEITAQAENYAALFWSSQGDGTFDTAGELFNTYYPGNQDIAYGYVTICFNATGNAGCEDAADCMTIGIQKLPEITIGDDLIICEDEVAILDATVNNYASLLWTSTGDGTFSDPNAATGTYVPGANDLTNGNAELCLTATGMNGCADAQECIMVAFEFAPIAAAGGDQTVCSGDEIALSGNAENSQSVLWETTGDGTFDDASELNAVYHPGPQDLASEDLELCLIAYGSDNCDPDNDCLTITFQPAPVSVAGEDKTICDDQSVNLSGSASNYASLTWSTSGDGSFSDPQIINPVYQPGSEDIQADTVTLCLTAYGLNGCTEVSDCFTLSIFGVSTVDAGNDMSICENEPATLSGNAQSYSSLLWTTDGDGTFDNASDLTTGYNPGVLDVANGNVELCLNAEGISPCEGNFDCTTLHIFESPVMISGDDIETCADEAVELNMEAYNYQSALWETNGDGTFMDEFSLNTIYYPGTNDLNSGGTEVCLTLDGFGTCGEAVSCRQILILDQPSAYAGEDASVLHDDYIELSLATADNYQNVYWTTDGSGTFENENAINATYYPDTKDVLNDYIKLIINAEQTEPCNQSTADTLLLEVIANASCFDVELNAGNNTTVCEGEAYTPSGATSYFESSLLWTTTGDGTFDDPLILHPAYTPGPVDIASGFATLKLKGFAYAPCIGTSDEVVLTIQKLPVAFAGNDNTVPDDQTAYYISDAYADHSTQVQWIITNGTGYFDDDQIVNATYTPSINDLATGSVILTFNATPTGPCTLTVTDDLVLTFSEGCVNAVAEAGDDISLCPTDTTFQVSGLAAYFSQIEWTTTGDGTFDHNNVASPNYTLGSNDRIEGEFMLYLNVEPFEGCGAAMDSVKVEPMPMPVADAGPDQTICKGETALLDQAIASNFTVVEWSTSGDGSFEDSTAVTTTYIPGPDDSSNMFVELTLTASSNQPCEVNISNTMNLEIENLPELVWDIDDVEALVGEDVPLVVVAKHADSYQWYGPDGILPGETQPILLLLEVGFGDAGFYFCKLSNDCGTTLSNLIKLGVYEKQTIALSAGWNGLSGYIQPYNLDVVDMFAAYPDFVLIKNYNGMYFPGQNINTMLLWNSQSGYEVNFTDDVTFELLGAENNNQVVYINQGWNYLPVISSCEVDIDELFSENQSKINIIKEIAGTGIYWPAMGVNTIGHLVPGNAYNLRAGEAFNIEFESCTETKSSVISPVRRPENHTTWNDVHYTPSTHTIAIDPEWSSQFEKGDVIGAFTPDGLCAGFMELTSTEDALVLFADDPLTTHADGFKDNEPISLRLFKTATGETIEIHAEFDAGFPQHNGVFVNHGMSRLIKSTPSGINNRLADDEINLYPNPTFGKVTVTGLMTGSKVEVWNSEGQMLRSAVEVNNGNQGWIDLDLSGCAAGVVYIRIYNQNEIAIRKLMLR